MRDTITINTRTVPLSGVGHDALYGSQTDNDYLNSSIMDQCLFDSFIFVLISEIIKDVSSSGLLQPLLFINRGLST